IEVAVLEAVRMFGGGLKSHQIHDVDDADFQVREVAAEVVNGGKRFEGGDVAATGHHDIGFHAAIGAGPLPDTDAGGAMLDGRIHIEVLQGGLFARDDDVDIIPAAQAMIHDREQGVRVGRQVYADDVGLFVD